MVRFARLPLAAAVLLCTLVLAAPLTAQEIAPAWPGTGIEAPVVQLPALAPVPEPQRPGALVPLYVSFAALQLVDVHSTSRALERGSGEANPLMKGFAGHEVGLLAVKAAGTMTAIYAAERMWKRNRTAAIVFMIASNSAMAWVVQHNYGAAR